MYMCIYIYVELCKIVMGFHGLFLWLTGCSMSLIGIIDDTNPEFWGC